MILSSHLREKNERVALVMPSFLHVEKGFNWLPQELSIFMISCTKTDTDFSTVSESAQKEGSLISALCLFFSSADHDTAVDP